MNAIEAKAPLSSMLRRWPPQLILLVTFACFYFAIGPGNFFAVDEVMEEETAQALILRRSIDIPVMVDSRFGRGRNWYTVKGPGLPMVSLPFVYLGLKLDDAFGSLNGGQLAGPPVGPEEQPLRWSGRLAISSALIVNAIAGGAIVAVLFMIGTQLSPKPRAALLMAIAAGLATLVMSEATHFYQHELDALMVILAFYFFSRQKTEELDSVALFGGLSLGVAILARPDAVPAAVIIWFYGAAVAWKLVRDFPDRWSRMMRRTLLAAVGPLGAVAGSMYFNFLRFGSVLQFGYTEDRARFVLDVPQIAKAIAGYLVSPGLSVFLFAPPLILAVAVGRKAYRRWPLETSTLILAALAHLLMIASNKTWSGDLSYGPRYMLESIVLLMPLTLPAFEMAVERARSPAAIAVGAVVFLGFIVQVIGVSVDVDANEVKRIAAGIVAHNAWVFVPKRVAGSLRSSRSGGPSQSESLGNPGAGNSRPGAPAVDCPGRNGLVERLADIPVLQDGGRRACEPELARISNSNRGGCGSADFDRVCDGAADQPNARRPWVRVAGGRARGAAGRKGGVRGGRLRAGALAVSDK